MDPLGLQPRLEAALAKPLGEPLGGAALALGRGLALERAELVELRAQAPGVEGLGGDGGLDVGHRAGNLADSENPKIGQ